MNENICQIKINEIQSLDNNIDKETIDENDYDSASVTHFLDFIYSNTKDDKTFKQLYYKAANLMLSEDLETGLTILLSYDYLFHFHLCLVDFFTNKNKFNENNINYSNLLLLL
tara:strand:+ start:574 stop:912 length:339 start_codon:yes stop_codon:yes gene_type:complete